MYLTLSYSDGRRMEAVVLAMSRDWMRLAVRGQMETTEFHLIDSKWANESGERIELDSLVLSGPADMAVFRASLHPAILATHANEPAAALIAEPEEEQLAYTAGAGAYSVPQ